MELDRDKVRREAIEKYRKERFAFWKDVVLMLCAVIGGVLGALSFFGIVAR